MQDAEIMFSLYNPFSIGRSVNKKKRENTNKLKICLALCMLGNFSCFPCRLSAFFKINFFDMNTIRALIGLDPYQDRRSVVRWNLSGSKLFAKVISRQQNSPLARR